MSEGKMTYKFSPSSLSLLKDCPICFWLHFNKNIKRPAGIFPSLPSGMDKILKNHFDKFMKKGLLPPELATEKDMDDMYRSMNPAIRAISVAAPTASIWPFFLVPLRGMPKIEDF